jgi:hypothetical protein
MKLISLTPIDAHATYRLFESLTVSDRNILKEASGLASDAELEKLLKKIAVEIDSNKQPEDIDINAIEQDAKSGNNVKEGTLNESLIITLILAAPTLLKLLGKLVDWVYSKINLTDAQKAELKKFQDEYAAAVKSHDEAKKTELEDKIYATQAGKWIGNSARKLHELYVLPIEKLVYGIGWLKDDDNIKKHAHSVAEVLYVITMLGVAGYGVYHSLHSMPSVIEAFRNIGLNFDNVATLVIDSIKGGDMSVEGLKMILKSVLKKASI